MDLHNTVHNTTEAPDTRVIVSSSGSRRGRSNDKSRRNDDDGGGSGGGSSDGSSDGGRGDGNGDDGSGSSDRRSLLLIITGSHAPNVGLRDGVAVGDGRDHALGAWDRGWGRHLAVGYQ